MTSAEVERWVVITGEVAGLVVLAYLTWLYLPESVRLRVRHGARSVRAPFDAAAAGRRARAEMMADIIELVTFGVPQAWARAS